MSTDLTTQLQHLDESFIYAIKDFSDRVMGVLRMRIIFTNGLELSIIHGVGTHSDGRQTFEIAVFEDGQMTSDYFDEIDYFEAVIGHCTLDKLNHYILKIGTLDGSFEMLEHSDESNI